MLNSVHKIRTGGSQRGAAAVEFSIVLIPFFMLFFGIVEFGRFFYLYNTVQELTRCAARQGTVSWTGQWDNIRQQCLFGQNTLVAGWEISAANIRLRHLNICDDPSTSVDEAVVANPGSAINNISECLNQTNNCIRFVEASVWCDSGIYCETTTQSIKYSPSFGLIPLNIDIPNSTVCMPAESLGY